MNFADILHLIKAYLYRQVGEKDFDKTGDYMEKVRENKLYLNDTIYSRILNTKTVKNNLSYLLETTTETYTRKSELLKFDNEFNSLINNPYAGKDDSIHTKEVKGMIMKGIGFMKVSSDPFHDMGHIMRCLRYAKVLFGVHKEEYKLDWGTLVLAVVWHDVSRSIIDTWLYDRRNINMLGKIPFLLDFFIIKDGLRDSKKSAILFRNMCVENDIDEKIIAKVMGAISEDVEYGLIHKDKIKDDIYFKLHSDIDFIDMYSIARFESGMRNVMENNKASVKFFQRSILIASLLVKINRDALNFEESKHIYDFSVYNLYKFGQVFYPEDTKKLFKPYVEGYLSSVLRSV